ncbi:hypothetical protein CH063_00660, partial [Colletotrichum higginsianum]
RFPVPVSGPDDGLQGFARHQVGDARPQTLPIVPTTRKGLTVYGVTPRVSWTQMKDCCEDRIDVGTATR